MCPPMTTNKKFVLKQTFNVSKMIEGREYFSQVEDHFGAPWQHGIRRGKCGCLTYLLRTQRMMQPVRHVSTEIEVICTSKSGEIHKRQESFLFCERQLPNQFVIQKIVKCEETKNDYSVNDELTIEVNVSIKKMIGFHGGKLRNFDETAKENSDFMVIVGGRQFYVAKFYLAAQSSFLRNIVMEKNRVEHKFNNIDPDDFQKFLEILYGLPAVNEYTVEGILLVADEMKASNVIRRCEEYLIGDTKKTWKKKMQIANRYKMEKLKKKLIEGVKNNADLRAIVSTDLSFLERPILETLLLKSLDFK